VIFLPLSKDEKTQPSSANPLQTDRPAPVCNLIPTHVTSQLARLTGADLFARSFSNWSHVVALLYAQLVHAIGLNDVCDGLRLHSGPLSAIRAGGSRYED